MAEEQAGDLPGETNGNGADNTPSAGVLMQYVKDFSFENPNSPAVYQWQSQPRTDVQFSIGTQPVAEEVHEVLLRIEITAKAEDRTAFAVELAYAGLFALRNVPADQIQPWLLVEAPRILFPFARRIVSDAIQDGGFPPLLLDPIDFAALYAQQAQTRQQGGFEGSDQISQA